MAQGSQGHSIVGLAYNGKTLRMRASANATYYAVATILATGHLSTDQAGKLGLQYPLVGKSNGSWQGWLKNVHGISTEAAGKGSNAALRLSDMKAMDTSLLKAPCSLGAHSYSATVGVVSMAEVLKGTKGAEAMFASAAPAPKKASGTRKPKADKVAPAAPAEQAEVVDSEPSND